MRKLIYPTILVVLFLGLVIYSKLPKTTYSPVPALTYPTPAEIIPIVQRLGIDPSIVDKINIKLDNGVGPCIIPGQVVWSCQLGNVIWYPRTILSQPEILQNQYFAHEYMHYIWTKEPHTLTPLLLEVRANSPELQQRTSGYSVSELPNELHSFICAEMRDSELPQPILQECLKYLPNRQVLPSDY